jgi:hypothetical protein
MDHDTSRNRPPAGSITEVGTYTIDLTGPKSHSFFKGARDIDLTIGPASGGEIIKLYVAPDDRINWQVFTPFASQTGLLYPRGFEYHGGDTGFFDWAKERPITKMDWVPILSADTTVDASQSKITELFINMKHGDGRLHLTLPEGCRHLKLWGNLSLLTVDGTPPNWLKLRPSTSSYANTPPYLLPDLGPLEQVSRLTIDNLPVNQPVSLEFIERFPRLTSLSLSGAFCDLEKLAERVPLKRLSLNNMAHLDGLPPLTTWPELDTFTALDIEEKAGKDLRQQLKSREAARPWIGHAFVRGLRKPQYWETNRPFSSWPVGLARKANKAYDTAEAALAAASSIDDVKAALITFTIAFNKHKNIETVERENIAEAVWHLSRSQGAAELGVAEDMAMQWFDQNRDY